MAVQLSSGITIEEESPQVRAIQGGASSITAALGLTERGPLEPQLITSFPEFQRLYGRHILGGYLSHAVQGFFDNGGRAMYVKRVVHYDDPTDLATKTSAAGTLTLLSASGAASGGTVLGTLTGAFRVADGQTLVLRVNGAAPVTATFNGTEASVDAGGPGPYALADGQDLTVTIDGGAAQTLSFLASEFTAIGAATAAEVAAVLNAKLVHGSAEVVGGAVRISSDRRGSLASVAVTGGSANGTLGFATAPAAGTGNVGNLEAVTPSEVITILSAAAPGVTVASEAGRIRLTSNTTGPTSSVQVDATSTARSAFGFDTAVHAGGTGAAAGAVEISGRTDGAYANDLTVVVEAATNGRATDFNLTVEEGGLFREFWPNLSTVTTSPSFHELVLNHATTGSIFIRSRALSNTRPANGTHGPLTGGDDGLAGLTDDDFIGAEGTKTGLRAFDVPEDARLLICPDRTTPRVQLGMVDYCATTKKGSMFAILDSLEGQTVQSVRTYLDTTSGLEGLTEFGAFYYPRIKISNPQKALYGSDETLLVPPSGHIAGIYARTDNATAGGVYQAPAGTERGRIVGCVGLENTSTQEEKNRDLLYPSRINPIRIVGGVPILDGVRTLKGDGNFPTISERRGVIYIEQAIKAGMEFARFRNNDAELRSEIERTILAFLTGQMLNGAFRSRTRASAFFVDVSEALNPPSVVFQGCVVARIGLATQKPAEFIVLRFSQDTRALTSQLGI